MKTQITYSCKRKRDFVTTLAVLMFVLIGLFEVYLIAVLPVQLGARNAMINQVESQRLGRLIDDLRDKLEDLSYNDTLKDGEVQLVRNNLDVIAIYLRENQLKLTPAQTRELSSLLRSVENIVTGWDNGIFRIGREEFDTSTIVGGLEKRLGMTPDSTPTAPLPQAPVSK